MDKFEEIAKAEQGAMIGLFGQKRRFTIRARSERFVREANYGSDN